jgi:sigma-B regulation protein RsbU (phosphoserine phosphatase)
MAFEERDERLAQLASGYAAIAIENARLYALAQQEIRERVRADDALQEYSDHLVDMVEERTRDLREVQAQLLARQRLQQEIELAAQTQVSLLPRQVPSFDGFEFGATALSARYVSGDLYDFVLAGPETCHIVLADISGKGIPAALLASTARTLVRAETEHEASPAVILSNVNASFYEDLTSAEMFITFLAARLDVRLGTLTYASAGHTDILWWQQAKQTCLPLSATGLPVGIFADTTIAEETHILRPGDALVFYSDGITEAVNSGDELFGLERLMDLFADRAHLSASDLAQAIVESVESFRSNAPRSDDVTLVVLKVLPRIVPFACSATLNDLNRMTALVQQTALAYGSDFAYQLELVVSEIVTNVIKHAYRLTSGEIRGQIGLFPDRVEVDLYDDGTPFDLLSVPTPDLSKLQEGRYGLFIARQLTDELVYTPATPEGNHWQLIKLAETRGAS